MKYYVGNRWYKRPAVRHAWRNTHQLKRSVRKFTDIAISKAWTNQLISTVDSTTVYKHRIKPKDQLW